MGPRKIDVHHHVIPPELAGVMKGMRGMHPVEWTYEGDDAFSKDIGVATRIFSTSTPGVSHVEDPKEAAILARSFNEYSATLRDNDPASSGFFATVPSLRDTDLAIQEVRHAYDQLRCDGVTLFTSYGRDCYLGHEDFVPVWMELNARNAVIFVHPCDNGKDPVLISEHLPGPAFDWPHETGRTAMDLILHKRLFQFPNVKIILSHGGGTLISLVRRSTLISLPAFGAYITKEDILQQAKSFYFDTALSGSPEILPMLLGFAEPGHILFGSDYPHATAPFSKEMTKFIDDFPMDDERRKDLYFGAAEALFPRLRK